MVLVGGLNPGPPALEASTLPLGYRWGGALSKSSSCKELQTCQIHLNHWYPQRDVTVIILYYGMYSNYISVIRAWYSNHNLSKGRVSLLESGNCLRKNKFKQLLLIMQATCVWLNTFDRFCIGVCLIGARLHADIKESLFKRVSTWINYL